MESTIHDPIGTARQLVKLGVPLFLAGLDVNGNPEGCPGWQRTPPGDMTPAESWRPGLALCAVMGHVFDVLDVDPRHGGTESARMLAAGLDGQLPRFYAKVATPSGGWHYWLATLGLAKRTGFRPGLDYQGGQADGTGRGFAFIPPTVRPSKADGVPRPYRWLEGPCGPDPDDRSGAALAAAILAARTTRPARQATAGTPLEVTSSYMRAALTRELETVATAAEGGRHNAIRAASWALGRFVAAGLLDADATEDALMDAAGHAGVPSGERKALDTIRRGFSLRESA